MVAKIFTKSYLQRLSWSILKEWVLKIALNHVVCLILVYIWQLFKFLMNFTYFIYIVFSVHIIICWIVKTKWVFYLKTLNGTVHTLIYVCGLYKGDQCGSIWKRSCCRRYATFNVTLVDYWINQDNYEDD